MAVKIVLAAVGAFLLACIFCAGLLWMSRHRNKPLETMKAVVWLCLVNGCAWVWCSYLLAYIGRTEIAESLSKVALTEIVAVVFTYAMKSLFENMSKNNRWPDKEDPPKGGNPPAGAASQPDIFDTV
jgi:uncharacterized membrane protein|uniref:Uncharacterized protein n=1 Tax=Siphoviridae sp. ctP6113 TaxID=2826318 RepID=A0A8S5MTP5_9CAUD|nr:MAG TPA: hypothetical protein [Siphoviridae sp. ctP6113]